MAKKFGKFLLFSAAAASAAAGAYYFMKKKNSPEEDSVDDFDDFDDFSEDLDDDSDEKQESAEDRSYVNLGQAKEELKDDVNAIKDDVKKTSEVLTNKLSDIASETVEKTEELFNDEDSAKK